MLPQSIQNGFLKLVTPLISLFSRFKINPNHLTTLGLIFNFVGAGYFIYGGQYGLRTDLHFIGWGGFYILIGGLCDLLDGKVARATGLSTRFGALYDSVLDRYSEVTMFFGMGYYLVAQNYFYESVLCFSALGGSTMVSYIRARSEGLQLECKVGLMQRPERIVWLGFGSLFCGMSLLVIRPDYVLEWQSVHIFKPIYFLTVPIFMVAVLSNFTCVQRMIHSHRQSLIEDEKLEKEK